MTVSYVVSAMLLWISGTVTYDAIIWCRFSLLVQSNVLFITAFTTRLAAKAVVLFIFRQLPPLLPS